jgi:hypothetical protein
MEERRELIVIFHKEGLEIFLSVEWEAAHLHFIWLGHIFRLLEGILLKLVEPRLFEECLFMLNFVEDLVVRVNL